MITNLLAHHLELQPEEVHRLLALSTDALYSDPTYQRLVAGLDRHVLENTAGTVRELYEHGLEPIKARHNLSDTVMSGYTLANWVLGFMMYPDRLPDMLTYHTRLSPALIAETLPDLVDLLVSAEEDFTEWKRALLIFSMPLLVKR